MSQPLPPKKEVALALLERSSVHLHLDPRMDGVVVPTWFKKQPQLVLQIGLNMPVPIPDLRLDDDGMSCTLSFNRSPFYCMVPWSSVFAMVGDDMRGMVWPDDMPPEVAQQSAAKTSAGASDSGRPAQAGHREPPPKRTLREVPPPPAATSKPKRSRKKATPTPVRNESPRAARTPHAAPVAVPSPPPSSPTAAPRPAAAPRAVPAPAATPAMGDAEAPTAPRSPGGASRKPKRELPPYLRVVK